MGSCFSSTAEAAAAPGPATAKVVDLDGALREYSSEEKVYEVLGRRHPSYCICSADELYCNATIPALGSQDSLQMGQLYFVLPVSMIEYPLSGSDMAALAVKASLALSPVDVAARSKGRGRGRRAIQVMPVAAEVAGDVMNGEANQYTTISRSSEKKVMMRRSASFRAKLRLRRSQRERLSTIEEVAE